MRCSRATGEEQNWWCRICLDSCSWTVAITLRLPETVKSCEAISQIISKCDRLFNCHWSEITNTQAFPCEYPNKNQMLLVFYRFLFFFPVWVKQKPQQMFCIHCVFHSQLLQSVVSKRECFLMGLLCLFFLSNITLCLLMVLVSLSRIVSTFMTAVWDTTTAETGCKCTAWRSGEIYCGMVELPLS